VADFKRLGPSIFAGTETPLAAEQWLVKIEQLLKAARISEADKVDVMGIQLTDLAHIWWTNELERLGEAATWDVFTKAFLDKFFPETAKFEMERRFTSLTQGSRSVDDYAAEFTRLSRFAPALVADEATRARRFKSGLDFSILENVASLRLPTFDEVLIAAREQEIVQKRRRAAQRSSQIGNGSGGKPSGGPIRRPVQIATARAQPYQTAPVAENLVCDHCSKPGHVRKDCRKLHRLCHRCGSKDHMIRDCPRPMPGQQGAPDRRQAFSLTAEDAKIAQGVVEGIPADLSCSFLHPCFVLSISSFHRMSLSTSSCKFRGRNFSFRWGGFVTP